MRLYEDDFEWMSDAPYEKTTQKLLVDVCEGKVLVGGLGLGIVVEPLAAKDSVTRIVVVEKSPEVIEMVWKHLDHKGKGTVVCQDIFDYLKTTKEDFNYICIDVWRYVNSNTYNNIVLPLRKLAEKLVPAENVLCWQETEMRENYA